MRLSRRLPRPCLACAGPLGGPGRPERPAPISGIVAIIPVAPIVRLISAAARIGRETGRDSDWIPESCAEAAHELIHFDAEDAISWIEGDAGLFWPGSLFPGRVRPDGLLPFSLPLQVRVCDPGAVRAAAAEVLSAHPHVGLPKDDLTLCMVALMHPDSPVDNGLEDLGGPDGAAASRHAQLAMGPVNARIVRAVRADLDET